MKSMPFLLDKNESIARPYNMIWKTCDNCY
jgi:hypothetical protein